MLRTIRLRKGWGPSFISLCTGALLLTASLGWSAQSPADNPVGK